MRQTETLKYIKISLNTDNITPFTYTLNNFTMDPQNQTKLLCTTRPINAIIQITLNKSNGKYSL